MIATLEWLGCALGIAGALALALNRPWSGLGWLLFVGSNVCWISFGLLTGAMGLVTMQIAMTGTSVLGIHRWLIQPNRNRQEDL
jgi:hypothetical protein